MTQPINHPSWRATNTTRTSLQGLADELGLDVEVTGDELYGPFVIDFGSGAVEEFANFEEAVSAIREYAR